MALPSNNLPADTTSRAVQGLNALSSLCSSASVEWLNQSAAELAEELEMSLSIPLAAPATGRPVWLPAWATAEFFQNNPAFAAATAPVTISGAAVDFPAAAPAADRLPATSDFPKLSKAEGYWDWRTNFVRFAASFAPSSAVFGQVFNRALAQFTDTVAATASTISVSASAASASWEDALKAFLSTTDAAFLSAGYLDKVSAIFRGLRPTAGQTADDFIRAFNNAKITLSAVAAATNEPELMVTETEAARQLLAVINVETRASLRHHHGLLSSLTYEELTESLAFRWVPTAGKTPARASAFGRSAANDPPAANPRSSHTNRPGAGENRAFVRPAACQNHVRANMPWSLIGGQMGEPGSAARLAKEANLNGLGICLVCRGRIEHGAEGHVHGDWCA